jgi:hypothetical protein
VGGNVGLRVNSVVGVEPFVDDDPSFRKAWFDVVLTLVPSATHSGIYNSVTLLGAFASDVFDKVYSCTLPPLLYDRNAMRWALDK